MATLVAGGSNTQNMTRFFPIKNSIYPDDLWVLAMVSAMQVEEYGVGTIPLYEWEIKKHTLDIEFLYNNDFHEFPYGLAKRGPGYTLHPNFDKRIQAEINKYLDNYQLLMEELKNDAYFFQSEHPDVTDNGFASAYSIFWYRYFNEPVGCGYSIALRIICRCMITPSLRVQEDTLTVFYNIWRFIEPAAGFVCLDASNAWILTGTEHLYHDDDDYQKDIEDEQEYYCG